ncbi:hypothetical protein K440DRAFT_538087 [Wilcoxina mikolae CBS 423.85]|nr:hypothetical protein K440DRAFT_538087 [Wilcoxina mikolae CBS 423.85]
MVDCQKHIYGTEKALELINERFFTLPHFSDMRQFSNKFIQVKQWTGREYKVMLKVWLAVLVPLLKGHPNHLKFLESVTDFILIA